MDILGNTLEEIAVQKAGIIKEKGETIFVEQEPKINKIIEETCKKKRNILHLITLQDCKDISYDAEYQTFSYKEKQVKINLKGNKQIGNACIVLEAIEVLRKKGYTILDKAVLEGLKTVVHKARFEVINLNPTIIFDGGHNEQAIKNLKETINMHYNNGKKTYIVSILKTKDYKTVIKELIEDKEAEFIFTDGTKEKDEVKCYVEKEMLYNEALKYRKDKLYMDTLESAIQKNKKQKDRVIFIVGSFYTYKEVIENI